VTLTSDSLVSTKLRPSQARPKVVARPRLTEKLTPDPGRRLTLVSAPAGFGKTTLLVEWSKDRTSGGRLAAWVSLDEGDNDPVRFLSYLVAALRTVDEGIGEGVLAALRSPEPPRIEALAGALINEMHALPGALDLILDDYHLIDSESIHSIISVLLELLPEGVHLVIASRVDPPLPLSRLRARNQMAELGAADLAFAPEEAAAFLSGVMGLELSAEDVATLEERTEGWIAGLQLAALSMRDRKDLAAFIESFSGSHRDVLDFLAEEVLERQPEHVREFLLETSILDNLTGSLCDALTGHDDGDEMLERLEKENLFVIALDDERRWYRYHRLFADFLRGRLGRESPERVGELHLNASDWNEQNGGLFSAIEHALSAGDHERAARLMELGVGQTWYRGEVITLLGWLEKLPQVTMRHWPLLLIWYAAALMLVGRLDGVEDLLREADRALGEGPGAEPGSGVDGDDPKHLLAIAAAVWSLYDRRLGDAPKAIEHARRALALLPEDNLDPRPFAAIALAQAYEAAGDREAASAAFADAGDLGRAAGHDYVALSAMASEAHLHLARGRLREADNVLRRALAFVAERGAELLPAVGSVRIGMGELLYEWNDLEAAARHLTEGVELAARTGDVEILIWGYVALSAVRQAWGDAGGALEKAREAERVARSSGTEQAIVEAATWKALLHLGKGASSERAAAAFEQEWAASLGELRSRFREPEDPIRARLLVVRNRSNEALRLLAELHETAQTVRRRIEALVLRALALQARGEKELAVGTLAQALVLAEPEGYVRTFVDEGPPMAELLSMALEARQRDRLDPPVSGPYLRKLLAAVERDALGSSSPGAGLPEPLSERELEVLQLIAAGKSNRRIATELFVSVGTVKTHINNLYRKLDAHSRTQALARAGDLNLL
jgi:LuxR family transcriptional regulator, maltose regulon positive regulatory protein